MSHKTIRTAAVITFALVMSFLAAPAAHADEQAQVTIGIRTLFIKARLEILGSVSTDVTTSVGG